MTEPTKQSRIRTFANGVKKHQTKILVTTNVLSLTAAVLMRGGLAQHNAFLKEHGLYEQFYALTDEA